MALREALATPMLPSLAEASRVLLAAVARKLQFLQSHSIVSGFGALLAHRWPSSARLSDQAPAVLAGSFPLPLYSCGTLDRARATVTSVEFSPLACRSGDDFIPPSGLGRRFDHGRAVWSDVELAFEVCR